MPSLESVGAALAALASGVAGGWAAARKRSNGASQEPAMDPEEWMAWRRDADARLRAIEQGQAVAGGAVANLTKQVDSLSADVKSLLHQVIELRIGLGQHPER